MVVLNFIFWWECFLKETNEGKKKKEFTCTRVAYVTFIEAIRRGFWIISEAISVEDFRVDEWNRFPSADIIYLTIKAIVQVVFVVTVHYRAAVSKDDN